MFCDKSHVNTLTTLLTAHGIQDAVVCPGSRNAVVVHNLHEAGFRLHPITDERSAAFVAIGLWLSSRRPVIVCVTSGSALLNLIPGVAEAAFRHIPLLILSADRPEQWIGQLDGQTLPQHGALHPYASTWTVPETEESDTRERHWYSNRIINESLCTLMLHKGPVHLNIPISEPLFSFTVRQLPYERIVQAYRPHTLSELPENLQQLVLHARCPLLVIGQYEDAPLREIPLLKSMGWKVFAENISNHAEYSDGLPTGEHDVVVHLGGAFVNKDIKRLLREQCPAVIRIDDTDEFPDTFCHLAVKLCVSPAIGIHWLAQLCEKGIPQTSVSQVLPPADTAPFEALFLANSTTVRWAERHISQMPLAERTYCNRGTNGIEGSLSVAAGYSMATTRPVLCITGDLSFFYDANSLWNIRLGGNLRILLVNNQGGGIFSALPGLKESPAMKEYIAATHPFQAKGIAESFGCTYIHTESTDLASDFLTLVEQLQRMPSSRPIILEVLTAQHSF